MRGMQHLKESVQTILSEAQFELHKWHSNVPALETDTLQEEKISEQESSYAKQQLGEKPGETKLLGMPWEKEKDTIAVVFPTQPLEPTKRELLGSLARIYDPLGLGSPTILEGKVLYREVCDSRLAWDKALSGVALDKWNAWKKILPDKVEIPRSLAQHQERIVGIDLHGFGDASNKGVASAVFTVVCQAQGTQQSLVTAKLHLAKPGLTIPRQDLESTHMTANLISNVKEALTGFPVEGVYGWLDSSVALHWIKRNGDYRQFVANRVSKIQQHSFIQWRYVRSDQNPADLGSRGGRVDKSAKLWWEGPAWLAEPESWPPNIVTMATSETQAEAKVVREALFVTKTEDDVLNETLEKHGYWKAIRIVAWIARFLSNCKAKSAKKSGPLTTEETETQVERWIYRVQSRFAATDKHQKDGPRLKLQKNEQGLFECRGRIQGDYPIYLPDDDLLNKKLVTSANKNTLHGGVSLTMAKVRGKYWLPQLRRLTKRVIKSCNGCQKVSSRSLCTHTNR